MGRRERSATTAPPDQRARKWLSPSHQVALVTLGANPLRGTDTPSALGFITMSVVHVVMDGDG